MSRDGGPERLLLGLIGAGIRASRTPALHEREAEAHGIRCLYQLIDLDSLGLTAEALPELLTAAERTGFAGLNVTHPCKQSVIPLLSELSDEAKGVGAVNTVLLRDRRRVGHNTDWWGFRESLQRGLPDARRGRVVQRGGGGGGAATAYAALKLGVERLDVFDVVGQRAEELASRLSAGSNGAVRPTRDVAEALAVADGLIHATPTGMASHPGLPLPEELLRPELWVADVVYFPLETPLLRAARRRGCRTLDGSGMALWQAVGAFQLFTGRRADAKRMRRFFDEGVGRAT
jgi:shikimate dehydrogenase